jgi:phosphoribosylformimino-5-aminoimidazole carboxamide ribotide isomerase
MLTRPNFEATGALIEAVAVPVIASGGVSRLEDIEELGRIGAAAVIVGKALYDGRLRLADALETAAHFRGEMAERLERED